MNPTILGEILIVEDNPADLKLMTDLLVRAGYQVRPASNGALALRSLNAKLPDLILLDVNLPDMLGVEVCRHLKELPETSNVPVIFISALDECDLKVQALDAGGTDYIAKPIEETEVLARIKTHLKMYRLQKELMKQSAELVQEIHERKQVEIINTRFSQMVEQSVNEIYAFDCETFQFVQFNEGASKNLGYSKTEFAHMTVLDIKLNHTFESFSELVAPLRTGTKEALVFETLHYRKDGTTYPAEIHLQLMPESPPLFVAMVLDITQRRQQEENLRESEERFRTAFEATDDCVLIWDKAYDYLYANQAAIDHVGATPEQVIGKNIRDGLGHVADFMHLWMSRIDQVFATGESLRVQDEIMLKGRQFFTDSILSPLCAADGSVTAVYVVYRDITMLKQAEIDLKDTHEIINRSPVVAFLWSNAVGWPVEYVSDNVSSFLGYTGQEFKSGEVSFSGIVHPDDLGRVVSEVACFSSEAECRGFSHEPYRLLARDGRVIWVDDRTTFRRDSSGEITHFQGIILDITEKIEADQNRIRLENSLYQSDKMASIGQLAAGVAHEINNPIGFISSNLKTMSEYVQDLKQHFSQEASNAASEEVLELLGDFEEAVVESLEGAQRVKKIVGDMMGISRPGSDKMEHTNLHEGIDSTLNIVWNQIKYNCQVKKDYGDIPQIECFKGRINQVFLNLLVNAGHAMEDTKGEIRIKTWVDDEMVHVSISDEGCGIPQENLTKLFDAFYTTKEVGLGTGLGLSLSRDIVLHHGGSLTVTSEVGQGAEFVVSLPIVPVTAPEAVPVA